MNTKSIGLLTLSILLLNCSEKPKINGQKILDQSISFHDPESNWDKAILYVHIQEPRLSNPFRYSILKLNNQDDSFELSRNRDEYVSKHIINKNGESIVLLNNEKEIDPNLLEKYRLDPSRNNRYQEFYTLMYGLPMSLNESIKSFKKTEEVTFKNTPAFKVEVQLKSPIISDFWNLYFSKTDYKMLGLEIVLPDDANRGERIYFDGTIQLNDIKIPRIRHWHTFKDDIYSGSDLIIKNLDL